MGDTAAYALLLRCVPSELIFVNGLRKLPHRFQFVSLLQLEKEDGRENCMLGKVLLLRVLYYRTRSIDKSNTIFNRINQTTKDSHSYDRTLTVTCLNSPPGQNTAIILLGRRTVDRKSCIST